MARKANKLFNRRVILFLGFLLALADAVAGYTQSSYLASYVKDNGVGLVIAASTLLTIIASFFYPRLIKAMGNYRSALLINFIILASTAALLLAPNGWVVIPAFIIRYAAFILLLINLDIYLEQGSSDKEAGAVHTSYLTFYNLAWLMSPILASWLVGNNLYINTYRFSFWIILVLGLFFAWLGHKLPRGHHPLLNAVNLSATLSKIWHSRDLRKIIISTTCLYIFYAVAVLYVPLRLNGELGFSWTQLGILFTVMLVPFVLIQYPAGLIADQKWGEKEMLIAGNIVLALSCIVFWTLNSHSLLLWAVILFTRRIGAAIVEAMQETYFFKKVKAEEYGLISMFRQTRTVGWLLGSGLAFALLSLWPLKSLFLAVAAIILLNTLSLASLKDTN